MSPGEEDDAEFVEDVAIRDVEVVLESCYVDVAIELCEILLACCLDVVQGIKRTNVLLHVLLPSHDGASSDLDSHLCCGVVHEASEGLLHVTGLPSHVSLRLLRRVAIAPLLL